MNSLKIMNLVKIMKLVVISLIIILFGCVSEEPKDVSVYKLELTSVASVTGKEIDYGRYNKDGEDIPRLKLEVASSFDLLALSKKKEVPLRIESYFCDSPDEKFLFNRSKVEVNGIEFEKLRFQDGALKQNDNGDYIYSIYLGLYSTQIDGGAVMFWST